MRPNKSGGIQKDQKNDYQKRSSIIHLGRGKIEFGEDTSVLLYTQPYFVVELGKRPMFHSKIRVCIRVGDSCLASFIISFVV